MVKNSELLSKLDPEVVRRFEERQVRYVRYLPDKSNEKYMNWQHVYQTDNREVGRHISSSAPNLIQALQSLFGSDWAGERVVRKSICGIRSS